MKDCKPNILVLGVGNILLSDESVGVHIVEQLEDTFDFPSGVEVVDGGTAGMELLDYIASRDHVIIIDAVLTGADPGTVVVLKDDDVPALFNNKVSPHQLGLSDLLGSLKLTDESPNHIYLVGVVPESVEPGLDMTQTVINSMPTMKKCVLDYLTEIGVYPRTKTSTTCV
ncbi:HyaD/HybD family hydrogenase maturation endopeptidase [Vibrio sp. RC27]